MLIAGTGQTAVAASRIAVTAVRIAACTAVIVTAIVTAAIAAVVAVTVVTVAIAVVSIASAITITIATVAAIGSAATVPIRRGTVILSRFGGIDLGGIPVLYHPAVGIGTASVVGAAATT